MSGTKAPLTPLESRKQLLLLESELNRVQLLAEVRGFKNELGRLQQQAQAISSLAVSVAKLAATSAAIRGVLSRREEHGKARRSWLSSLFKGLRAGAALWAALRSDQK